MVWLPQMDPVIHRILCKHEDFFHKIKRIAAAIRGQKPTSKTLGPVIFDRTKLLEVAQSDPRKFKIIVDAITSLSSDPMDPFAQKQLFVDTDFRKAVLDAGHEDMAFCLKVVGDWYEAYDSSGLSEEVRALRLQEFRKLFDAVFRKLWWSPDKPPSNVAGLPLKLWYALAANTDSARILLNVKLGSRFFDSHRQQLRARLSTLLFGKRNSRRVKLCYTGTYDPEGGFSTIVVLVGFKPSIRITLGVLRKAQITYAIRTVNRGFYLRHSRRAHSPRNVFWDKGIIGHEALRAEHEIKKWFGELGAAPMSRRDKAHTKTLMTNPALHVRATAKRAVKREAQA
mmetsp:Transcript_65999/g.162459  ORF Transcript_65999/g.162459 Transcript_65999/m.162459 type:complete len:340 (+) Transcript_65999:221-1240(+)